MSQSSPRRRYPETIATEQDYGEFSFGWDEGWMTVRQDAGPELTHEQKTEVLEAASDYLGIPLDKMRFRE